MNAIFKQINQLPSATTPLVGTEIIPIMQNGVTKQVLASAFFTALRADLAAPAGSSLSGFIQGGTGAVAETVQLTLRRTVYADQYDTVAHAIAAAGVNGELIFSPNTTYVIPATLTQLTGQRWTGIGGQRSSTLQKAFNGDLVKMGDLGSLNNLNLDCVGGTFSGRGIYVYTGSSQRIKNCRTSFSAGHGISIDGDTGHGIMIDEFVGDTATPLSVAVIGLNSPDTTARPRFISNTWLPGGLIDITGCNDMFINNVFCSYVVTAASSVNYYISNTRFASSGVAIPIKGAGGMFSNCAFAGAVSLSNTSGVVFDPACEFGFGITEDAASCLQNSFHTQSTAYTPVWDQASGTQPVLGNGTITGRYLRNGRICKVQIILTLGTTTTTGNGATSYRFSLPFTSNNAFTQNLQLRATVFDLSAGLDYPFNVSIAANGALATLGYNGAGCRDGFPIVWATGDIIKIEFEYSTL